MTGCLGARGIWAGSMALAYFAAFSHGDGTPTRMACEKSGDWPAALAFSLMRARSMSSLSGIVVTTAP